MRRTRLDLGTVMLMWLTALTALASAAQGLEVGSANGAETLPSIAEKTKGLELRSGLLDIFLDRVAGTVWLVVPRTDERGIAGEYLYLEGLETGFGASEVGLDRGELGRTMLVRLRRVGNRVLLEAPNLSYRTSSGGPAEARAVEQSFATSVLWGGEVAAADPDGHGLVDLSSFLIRDAHGVVRRLATADQGEFSLDEERSAIDLDSCLAFPDNLELGAVLTYAGAKPGSWMRAVAPVADALTLVQHHSLVRLPGPGFEPRRFDPREGSFAVSFLDFSAPLGAPLEQRFIARHRLHKKDPEVASSAAAEPIVYYVDRGAPEPVRSALVEGASWWAEAFAAAGFGDGFRVALLPEDAHPLDVRFNVIQWVNRASRGWSYGNAVIDPRTGEIVKGHVSLGALRVRQDVLIFEGLAGADRTGSGEPDDPVELALARIRQLSAHEVGHTLGFTHNYAASTYGGRASVMDYPAPLVRPAPDGGLDFSNAYGVGMGEWDLHAVRYAYSEPPPGADEETELERIVHDGLDHGLLFLSDDDARGAGAAHPLASLWDNGSDPVAELEQVLEVRRRALAWFGQRNIRPGRPLALLQEVLVPVYLYHRYQVEAAAKVLGGLSYTHAVRGDGQPPSEPVDAAWQRRALAGLLEATDPRILDLSDEVLALLAPRPFGYERHQEMFAGATEPALDALGAAVTATDVVLGVLLQPERLARLVDFHRRDARMPGAEEVLEEVVERFFGSESVGSQRLDEILRAQQRLLVDRLVALAQAVQTSPLVRTRVETALRHLRERLAAPIEGLAARDHLQVLRCDLERYLDARQWQPAPGPPALPPPPGSPIGADRFHWLD